MSSLGEAKLPADENDRRDVMKSAACLSFSRLGERFCGRPL